MASAGPGAEDTAEPAPDALADPSPEMALEIRVFTFVVGIPNPLVLSMVSSSATVGQLKLRIRDALPSRPPAESQRLIYQGRVLDDMDQTMMSVFGEREVFLLMRLTDDDADDENSCNFRRLKVCT